MFLLQVTSKENHLEILKFVVKCYKMVRIKLKTNASRMFCLIFNEIPHLFTEAGWCQVRKIFYLVAATYYHATAT